MGWTSIYQLFWSSLGARVLTNSHVNLQVSRQHLCDMWNIFCITVSQTEPVLIWSYLCELDCGWQVGRGPCVDDGRHGRHGHGWNGRHGPWRRRRRRQRRVWGPSSKNQNLLSKQWLATLRNHLKSTSTMIYGLKGFSELNALIPWLTTCIVSFLNSFWILPLYKGEHQPWPCLIPTGTFTPVESHLLLQQSAVE